MKLVTDNAFSKAWKKPCPTCNPDSVNSILWYNKQCHNCKKVYTEEDMLKSFWAGVDCEAENGKNFEQFINSLNKQD
jgi:hypothetical protein